LLVGFALLWPVLWPRLQILSLFRKNALDKLERLNALESLEVKFADRIRNCEDALLVEEHGLAIVGCDPGREIWNTVMVSRMHSITDRDASEHGCLEL
jgi:arylesterase/paraoxonase